MGEVELSDNRGPRRGFQNHPQHRNSNMYNAATAPIIVEELVTIEEKIFFPIDKYPGFNFVGRLLGPKGSHLKEYTAATKTKVSICGKGSSKDRSKEAELLKSEDPEHQHLKEPVHVIISVKAPKVQAHRRMAFALQQLNRFLVPGDDRVEPVALDEAPAYHDERDDRRRAPAPIIRVGVPPPGSIILNEEPLRRDERRRDDGYPPEDRYYESRRGGEREPRDSQRYDYPEDRRPPPRGAPSNGYSPTPKRYKEDPYARDPYAR